MAENEKSLVDRVRAKANEKWGGADPIPEIDDPNHFQVKSLTIPTEGLGLLQDVVRQVGVQLGRDSYVFVATLKLNDFEFKVQLSLSANMLAYMNKPDLEQMALEGILNNMIAGTMGAIRQGLKADLEKFVERLVTEAYASPGI